MSFPYSQSKKHVRHCNGSIGAPDAMGLDISIETETKSKLTSKTGAFDPDQMLTTEEAAALLSIQPNTLAKWRAGIGGLGPKFVAVGRAIRYRRADLRAYLEENTVSNNAEARTLRLTRD